MIKLYTKGRMKKLLVTLLILVYNVAYGESLKIEPKFDTYVPESEGERKVGEYRGDAYIDFKTGKANIDPKFGKNEEEINKILKTIKQFRGNKDLIVNNISIIGYASPEGKEEKNLELSRKRMKSLLEYIGKNGSLPDVEGIKTGGAGEDWQLLDTLVSNSELSNKEAILAIMRDNTLTADQREDKIKANYPRIYDKIFRDYYPKLRRTYYKIDYTVRDFDDINDINRIYLSNPEYLSIYELYRLLSYYPKYSKDYYRVLFAGAKYFPRYSFANINGGAAAIMLKDYRNARIFLMRVSHLPLGLYNLGVLACYENNFPLALEYFRKLYAMPEAADLHVDLPEIIVLLEKEIAEEEAFKKKKEDMLNASEEGGHKYVDLGLPSGTVWATCNLGATDYHDDGEYYLWGDVLPILTRLKKKGKEISPATCNVSYTNLRLDNNFVDDNDALIEKYDAAHHNWGGLWKMPTLEQALELDHYTTKKYVEDGDIQGMWLTSTINGNSIFFPVRVRKERMKKGGLHTSEENVRGFYWTSIPTTGMYEANGLTFSKGNLSVHTWGRCRGGLNIRPVFNINKKTEGLTRTGLKVENPLTPRDSTVAKVSEKTEHKAVDLGLPSGLKWATYNIGATTPYETGSYFSWGSTVPGSGFYSNQAASYLKSNEWLASHGYLSSKGVLSADHDAAQQIWGGNWRIPTAEDFKELEENTTVSYESINGVSLIKFTSKINGNSISFIGKGYFENGRLLGGIEDGYYWTSSPDLKNPEEANDIRFVISASRIAKHNEGKESYFATDVVYFRPAKRFLGMQIRAVCK